MFPAHDPISNIPQLPASGYFVDLVQPLSANKTIPVSNIYALNTPEEVASESDEEVGEQPVFLLKQSLPFVVADQTRSISFS